MEIKFPVYRKYIGLNTWFRIESERSFTEIRQIGDKYLKTEIRAEQFPEILFIQDMIECQDGRWEISSASDFDPVFQLAD